MRAEVNVLADAFETGQVVDPQADLQAIFRDQLPGKAPGNADVAVIVDDIAEDVPGSAHGTHATASPKARPHAAFP